MTDTNNKGIKIIDKEVKESEVIIGFWKSCGYPKYATQNHGIIDNAIKFGFNYSKQLHDNSIQKKNKIIQDKNKSIKINHQLKKDMIKVGSFQKEKMVKTKWLNV